MDDIVQLLCIVMSVTGSIYCLMLLWDGRKRVWPLKETARPWPNSSRRISVCGIINRLCQTLVIAGFLSAALFLLAGFVCQTVLHRSRADVLNQQLRSTWETVSFPGCPPVGVDYDTSEANRPIIGIDCSEKPITEVHLRSLIQRAPKLEYLNRAGAEITGDALRELSRLPRLTALCLERTRIGDRRLHELAKLPSLESLVLDNTEITDKGLRYLADLANLETLSLRATAVTDAGLEWICRLDKLKRLDLVNTGVTEEGIKRLKSKLPGIVIVHPEGNPGKS